MEKAGVGSKPGELISATEAGDVDSLCHCVEHGSLVDEEDEDGWSALFYFAAKGDVGTVQLLVKADASVQKKSGETALFYAARNGDINTVRLLVKFGAYVNEKNERGSTPLFLAASCDRADVVCVLVKLGVSTSEKNASGETPLNVAGEDIRTLLDKAVNHSTLGVDFSERHTGLKGQLTSAELAEPNDNAASPPVEAMLTILTEDETLKVPLLDAGTYAMSSFLVTKLGRVLPNVLTTLQEHCSFMLGWK